MAIFLINKVVMNTKQNDPCIKMIIFVDNLVHKKFLKKGFKYINIFIISSNGRNRRNTMGKTNSNLKR